MHSKSINCLNTFLFFAKRRYNLTYQNWDLLIKEIDLDAQL